MWRFKKPMKELRHGSQGYEEVIVGYEEPEVEKMDHIEWLEKNCTLNEIDLNKLCLDHEKYRQQLEASEDEGELLFRQIKADKRKHEIED